MGNIGKNISKKSLSSPDLGNNIGKTMVINFEQISNLTQETKLSHSYLVYLLGAPELVGKYWVLQQNQQINIGRNRSCDIQVQDLSISKKHLQLQIKKNNSLTAIDLNSTNGTIINDKSIQRNKEVEVRDNSIIKLGNVTFKFLDIGNPEIVSIKQNFKKVFYDSLTEVGNKLMLDKQAPEFFQNSKQDGSPLSIMIFDIDFFKKVNDTYGHSAGDFVLKEVARLVKSCFREDDLLVRCGGEEFCIIVNAKIDKANQLIELARQKVQDNVFEYKQHEIKLTISAGLTVYMQTDKIWKDIYDRADALLYDSKNTGRNKVTSS